MSCICLSLNPAKSGLSYYKFFNYAGFSGLCTKQEKHRSRIEMVKDIQDFGLLSGYDILLIRTILREVV